MAATSDGGNVKTILMLLLLSQITPGSSISGELKALFDADQKQRDGTIDWSKATPEESQAAIQRDVERAKRVREILATHNIDKVDDLIHAGTVLMRTIQIHKTPWRRTLCSQRPASKDHLSGGIRLR
jgi:hypothetical protein